MRHVFVRFLEEIEDSKKAFRNYLTFNVILKWSPTVGRNIQSRKIDQVRQNFFSLKFQINKKDRFQVQMNKALSFKMSNLSEKFDYWSLKIDTY